MSMIKQFLQKMFDRVKKIPTASNIVMSPHFLVWKFCGKAQFPPSFGLFTPNYNIDKVSIVYVINHRLSIEKPRIALLHIF